MAHACFGFESDVYRAQQHIVWSRRLRQVLMLMLNRIVDAD